VPSSWSAYFQNIEDGVPSNVAFQMPPQHGEQLQIQSSQNNEVSKYCTNVIKVRLLIDAFRQYGFEEADVDPLKMK